MIVRITNIKRSLCECGTKSISEAQSPFSGILVFRNIFDYSLGALTIPVLLVRIANNLIALFFSTFPSTCVSSIGANSVALEKSEVHQPRAVRDIPR